MNKIIRDIFKNKVVNIEKLINFGFCRNCENYIYKTNILDDQMSICIIVNANQVSADVIDNESNEIYTLHLIEGNGGAFVGRVLIEYKRILTEVANNCFSKEVFKSEMAKTIIKYIHNRYNDELQYLWEKFPNNAICRRQDNKKWYALFVRLPKSKLGETSEEEVDIINLRIDESDLVKLANNKNYYSAYHMNKKHWITICLDGSVKVDEIYQRIENSYIIAGKKQ